MLFGSRGGSWRIWLIIGLGLCLYGYYENSKLREPSAEALELAVEMQYRVEIARLQQAAGDQPLELTTEWQNKYRTAIRNEQLAPLLRARKRVHSVVGAGLLLLVLAASMFLYTRMAADNTQPMR